MPIGATALRLILAKPSFGGKGLQRPLSDDEELQVSSASASAASRRRRHSALVAVRSRRRPRRQELSVLQEFMPEPLSETELKRS